MAKAAPKVVFISSPNMQVLRVPIMGISPYVQNKFSTKARQALEEKHMKGPTAVKPKREAKDFEALVKEATHISDRGWYGIPASSFRAGMISACRIVGFTMTRAKLALFVVEDGTDNEGTGLVRITHGEPVIHKGYVRIENTIDIRWRPM